MTAVPTDRTPSGTRDATVAPDAPRTPGAPATPHAPHGAGVASGEPDLWCTYAAVRTLRRLERIPGAGGADATARYLTARRNADGGYAWSRGMASDAWATFYCTSALADLGHAVPQPGTTARWLADCWSGDAYGMQPGQTPDVWATHFSARTAVDICGTDVPSRDRLLAWLSSLQCADGGLSWTPGGALEQKPDVRACFYGVMAWQAAVRAGADAGAPWDMAALVSWLRDRQDPGGGFRFSADADTPCLWAVYRATATLAALGEGPRDAQGCVRWILGLRGAGGAFVRWEGYDVEDVWASFCAVGSLQALGEPIPAPVADAVARRLDELACPGGGYTYREPAAAADALATASAVLSAAADRSRTAPAVDGSTSGDVSAAVRWLEGCQLPNEGGVMYMPGRGSEVRCTLWALAAGAFASDPAARERIARWLGLLQNPDGGFGYWEGRGSDLVSTAAALETVPLLGGSPREVLDGERAAAFIDSCRSAESPGYANVPGAAPTLRAGLQALRGLGLLGRETAAGAATLLAAHRVGGGGYANEGRRIPDLLSGYEAAVASDRLGLALDTDHLGRFLARVRVGGHTAWTPLAPPGQGGPLADCLGTLLDRRVHDPHFRLPALALS
ncbi:prenyltransferase/squalene oxidase repeat-containing protein [Streptomyces yaizuensis]|uniref:Geranylgeranyl transferase type II subunit beta n=1 Tax=Streptomyces yaizuensis TaxID=2989713 RepID=A0ABQ5P462_9ACTN|nr:prenyltransferase/squalene oxidase repeat-containing protein [Streptomyces sp. YSPA8]GLF97026.1 prenyltransferase [Streptomyces sp. YSPA8]